MSIYRSATGAAAVEGRYRDLLDRWPVPSEQLRLSTREGTTFVVACGPEDAPPAVLIQGSGANAAMWLPDMAVWAKEFRVFAVDLLGEPGLSAPSRPKLASDAYACWLDEVLNLLGLAEVSLVGVSLGGWVALDYATRQPERVRRLVLVSPSGLGRPRLRGLVTAILLRRSATGAGARCSRRSSARPRAPNRPRGTPICVTWRCSSPRTSGIGSNPCRGSGQTGYGGCPCPCCCWLAVGTSCSTPVKARACSNASCPPRPYACNQRQGTSSSARPQPCSTSCGTTSPLLSDGVESGVVPSVVPAVAEPVRGGGTLWSATGCDRRTTADRLR